MPAKAGIQNYLKSLDSRLRGNDVKGRFRTYYETINTRKKLNWAPNSEFNILKRLPLIMNHFTNQRAKWEKRNLRRNEGLYEYQPDCQIL